MTGVITQVQLAHRLQPSGGLITVPGLLGRVRFLAPELVNMTLAESNGVAVNFDLDPDGLAIRIRQNRHIDGRLTLGAGGVQNGDSVAKAAG